MAQLYEPEHERSSCDNAEGHCMPDQSSAATEHAIIQEITAPLRTLPDDPVAVVNADFPVALRGYDRLAVDAYVQQTSQLVAELQATRSPEAAVRRALERVGEQISGILQRAHDTAEQITAQSRGEAEDRLEQARAEAREIAAAAEERVKDLDADTDRIWIERHRIVDDARDLASQLLALAETAAQRFPDTDDAGAPFSSGEDASASYAEDEDASASYAGDEDATAAYAGDEDATAPYAEDEDATTQFSKDELARYAADEEQLLDEDGVADDPEVAEPDGSPSVIPPASPAANRRSPRS
jgi:cell division septum initiation protein DivIVA